MVTVAGGSKRTLTHPPHLCPSQGDLSLPTATCSFSTMEVKSLHGHLQVSPNLPTWAFTITLLLQCWHRPLPPAPPRPAQSLLLPLPWSALYLPATVAAARPKQTPWLGTPSAPAKVLLPFQGPTQISVSPLKLPQAPFPAGLMLPPQCSAPRLARHMLPGAVGLRPQLTAVLLCSSGKRAATAGVISHPVQASGHVLSECPSGSPVPMFPAPIWALGPRGSR